MGIELKNGAGECPSRGHYDRVAAAPDDRMYEESRVGAIRHRVRANNYYIPATLIAEQILYAALQDRLCRQD
jgi:hypothetical protein